MHIEIYRSGIYRIVKISDEFSVISKLEELRSLIRGYLSQDDNFLAIFFSHASYLYSGAISVLISCYKMVKDTGGDLCIVEPKPEMLNLLAQMGINDVIDIYASEADLPGEVLQVEIVKTGRRN